MHSSHIANRNTQADLYIFKQMFTNKIHFSTAINGDDLAGILPKIDPTLLFKYCFPNFKNYTMFAKIGFPKLVNHHPDPDHKLLRYTWYCLVLFQDPGLSADFQMNFSKNSI